MWLDVVRYADTAGYETDALFPNAWRYRDYVIKSFNADKPYDVFIKEQIAADEIWPDNLDLDGSYDLPQSKRINLERRIGTSLYTLGALPVENTFFGDQYRAEWQADSVDVTGAAFLGLSLQLRTLPRSQVRSDLTARLLPPVSDLCRQRGSRGADRQPDAHFRIHAATRPNIGSSRSFERSTTVCSRMTKTARRRCCARSGKPTSRRR